MAVDWQIIFYITSAIGMMVLAVLGISIFLFMSQLVRFLKKVEKTTDKVQKLIKDVHYLRKDFKIGVLKFIINALKKGDDDDS
jgi:hypothetical protein